MPRYHALIFMLIAVIGFTTAEAQDWLWARGNTGTGMDGWPVATDPSGNVFAAGISWGYGTSSVFGSITVPYSVTTPGSYQSIIAKYDGDGNVLWVQATENGDTWLYNIATDASGNVFMFGAVNSPSVKIGTVTLTNPISPAYQYFLVKFDPSGNVVWAKSGSNAAQYAMLGSISSVLGAGGVTTDASGNIYITSSFSKPSVTIGTGTLVNSDPSGKSSDIFLAKYDPSGNVLWAQSAGGVGDDYAFGVTATPAGDVYITGDLGASSVTFGPSVLTNPNSANAFPNQVPFIARYTASGTPLWACSGGGLGNDYAVGISSDALNNVYLTGGLIDNSISFSGTTITNPTAGHAVLYLVKLDASNTVSWFKTIKVASGPSHIDSVPSNGVWGYSIAMSKCGIIWVSGAMRDSTDIDGHILKVPANSPDPVFIAGYSTTGAYAGSAALQSGGDDQNGIACDATGNVYMCSDYWSDLHFHVAADTLLVDSGKGELLYVAKHPYSGLDPVNAKHSEKNVCLDSRTIIASEGYTKYLWSNGATGKTYTITDTGTVWVRGSDTCSSAVDTFKIIPICDCSKVLFVPNAFTPNGDGQDDVFYPRTGPGINIIKSFRVYNRWGELLFDRENILANDASNAWDGTYRGEKPLPDVYVWVVDAVCETGAIINKKGSVTVIR